MGAVVQLSARAANIADDEADYALSPFTRWTIGASGGLSADSAVPPAAMFGLSVTSTGGGLDLSAPSFTSLVNTRSVIGGTYSFFLYDEVNGQPGVAVSAPIAATDTVVRFASAITSATYVQIDAEVLLIGATDTGGNTTVQRGMLATTAAAHNAVPRSPIF